MSGLNPEVAENSVGAGDTIVDCSLAIGIDKLYIYKFLNLTNILSILKYLPLQKPTHKGIKFSLRFSLL